MEVIITLPVTVYCHGLAKHVKSYDKSLVPQDEILISQEAGKLLLSGTILMSSHLLESMRGNGIQQQHLYFSHHKINLDVNIGMWTLSLVVELQ